MSVLRESLAIFKRNPWTSTFTLLLIIGASVGQVVSLSSLYPVLQVLVSGQNGGPASGTFVSILAKIGAAPTFFNLLLLFIVLGVTYSVLNWAADAFQNLQLKKFETAIRQELFESAVRAKWVYARDLRHGEFLSVMIREVTLYRELIRRLLHTFGAFFQFAALFAYAFYLNWQITGLGALIFAAGALVLVPILRWSSFLGKRAADHSINMSNRLVAALRSLKMVKTLSLEKFLIGTVQPSFEAYSANVYYSISLTSGQYAIMEIIGMVAVSSMLFAGLLILSIPKAELMVILLLLFRALPLARLAIDNYHQAYGFAPSMVVTREHLAAAGRTKTRSGGFPIAAGWKRIACQNVEFAYEDRTIVGGLSVNISRGEFWAILGPSGSGKTTLLDLITGLLEPQSGSVSVDDVPLSQGDIESWHAQIAYLGQDAFVFAGTVRDNLVWGSEGRRTDTQLKEALRAAKLDPILDREAGENGSNLSGGEKQRLALARLFLRQPTLVILDEPTTGLDASTEKEIFESISSYFRETTLVMVTHREELARGADHVIRFTNAGIRVEAGAAPRSASMRGF